MGPLRGICAGARSRDAATLITEPQRTPEHGMFLLGRERNCDWFT